MEDIGCHENLECLLSPGRGRLRFLIAKDISATRLFERSIRPDHLHIIEVPRKTRYFLDDHALCKQAGTIELARSKRLKGFIPSYRSSAQLDRWAREHGISLISPTWTQQRRLEDKLHFFQLMEAHQLPTVPGAILQSIEEFRALPRGAWVAQTRHGEGGSGTFLLHKPDELIALLARGKARFPLLCRKYLRGFTYGISLLIGKQDMIFSALRVQCRDLQEPGANPQGVQWVASSELDRSERTRIAQCMQALGHSLQAEGFLGVVNIDFIVSEGQVYLVECNPRFSAATPQLSSQPDLLHGCDFIHEYILALRGLPLSLDEPRLPSSSFEGCYIDFSDWLLADKKHARQMLRAIPRLGVYERDQDCIRFKSEDIAELKGEQALLFHYSSLTGSRTGARSDMGSIFANFRLFDRKDTHVSLRPEGQALLSHFAEEVVFGAAGSVSPDTRKDKVCVSLDA